MSRTRRSVLHVMVAGILAVACGGGDDDAARFEPDDYPPTDIEDVRPAFVDVLARHDVELTRAPLIDRSDGRYEESPTGRHLALYVQPPDDQDAWTYIRNVQEMGLEAAEVAFTRWPALTSFDICQEPPDSVDDSETPPPWTQLVMTREAWEALPSDLDLPGMIVLSRDPSSGITITAHEHLLEDPAVANAIDEADRRQAAGGRDAPRGTTAP